MDIQVLNLLLLHTFLRITTLEYTPFLVNITQLNLYNLRLVSKSFLRQ